MIEAGVTATTSLLGRIKSPNEAQDGLQVRWADGVCRPKWGKMLMCMSDGLANQTSQTDPSHSSSHMQPYHPSSPSISPAPQILNSFYCHDQDLINLFTIFLTQSYGPHPFASCQSYERIICSNTEKWGILVN